MARDRVNPIAWVLAAATAVVLLVAGVVGYRTYTERYQVTTRAADGRAVAQVVRATFADASDLKVASLSGTVQATASDIRGFGWLRSDRVVKAPFAVDYFVDLGAMGPRAFAWDEASRTLTVDAPAVRAGQVNVDEARTYLDRTTGVIVTRDAMAALQRQASASAAATARAEALKPERLRAARESGRRAIAGFVAAPLRAAGIGDVRVVVRFPGEAPSGREQWDVSRSLDEVLRESR